MLACTDYIAEEPFLRFSYRFATCDRNHFATCYLDIAHNSRRNHQPICGDGQQIDNIIDLFGNILVARPITRSI